MAAKRCPKCKLINPEKATACDCGWSFVDRTMGARLMLPDEGRHEPQSSRAGQIAMGALAVALGMVVVLAATGGGAIGGAGIGAVTGGFFMIVRGIARSGRRG
jgi:hypothetical protein